MGGRFTLSDSIGPSRLHEADVPPSTFRFCSPARALARRHPRRFRCCANANGNLTSDGLRLFDYDASNRLTQVQVSKSQEASKITYLHNALGQRVFKSEPQVAQTALSEEEIGPDFVA